MNNILYLKSKYPAMIRQLNIADDNSYGIYRNGQTAFFATFILGIEFPAKVFRSFFFKVTGKEPSDEILKQFYSGEELLTPKIKVASANPYSHTGLNLYCTLHQLAAESYEELSECDRKTYYERIICHYKLSNNAEKYKEYLWLQAQENILKYEYAKAKSAYFTLLDLEDDNNKKFQLILKIGEIFRNASEWSEEIKLYEKCLSRFSGISKDELVIKLCELNLLKGNHVKYKEFLRKISHKHKHSIKAKLLIINANFELSRGNYDTSMYIAEQLLSDTISEFHSEALAIKGIVLAKMHDFAGSIEVHKKLLKESEERNDKHLLVKTLINIAEDYFYMGDYSNAYDNYERALRISRRIHRKNAEAVCLGNLGTICYVKNDYSRAITFFVRQLKIFISIGNRIGTANSYGMLGASMISTGAFKKALEYLNKQQFIVSRLKAKKSLAVCLGNIGVVHNLKGEFDLAIREFEKQLKIDEEINNHEGKFRALGNIGNQYRYKGKYNISSKYFKKAIEIAQKREIKLNLETVYCHYAAVLFELKKFDNSAEYALMASAMSQNLNNSFIKTTADIIAEKSLLYKNPAELAEVNNCCSKILAMKKTATQKESIALINFELWRLRKDFGLPAKSFCRLAYLQYSILNKEVPKFDYLQKLEQLTS